MEEKPRRKAKINWPNFDDVDLAIIAGVIIAIGTLSVMDDANAETVVLAIITGIFGLAGVKK